MTGNFRHSWIRQFWLFIHYFKFRQVAIVPVKLLPFSVQKINTAFLNSLVVNRSGASSKKTGVPVLLNALDSTRFYVGSYARDARLRPSRLSKQVKTT